MLSHLLLEGSVLWAYDYELANGNPQRKVAGLFSFIKPLYSHKGRIVLTDHQISIKGDEYVNFKLNAINQLFLGFDEFYPSASVKNLGIFWQPLRIEYINYLNQTCKIYLVIGYNGIYTQNKIWYNTIKEMLSST